MRKSFASLATFSVDGRAYRFHRIAAASRRGADAARLPLSYKILLENLLRHQDGATVSDEDILAVARGPRRVAGRREVAFRPGRVLLQDSTAVPVLGDLAALRDAVARSGGDPRLVNPVVPTELVVDHSLRVDSAGNPDARRINAEWEYRRNRERFAFFRWAQASLAGLSVTPPGNGIVHQVNLESLARLIATEAGKADRGGLPLAYPETWVGTDSHTTMINGLGVLGWGVGGIEAEAVMLGLPITLPLPEVVGVRILGSMPDGTTATDLVLHVTQVLRRRGVVGAFVEFFGEGLDGLPVADRATVANMAPEYGATCALFPIDSQTLKYLRLTDRPEWLIRLVEAYARAQGLFRDPHGPRPDYSEVLELDLAAIEPSLAGPSRPEDRVRLRETRERFASYVGAILAARPPRSDDHDSTPDLGRESAVLPPPSVADPPVLGHGAVVIAAITSCTNTSNPSAMIAAGLLARKAVERGLMTRPWVKTSLAPGSRVVADYLDAAGLTPSLDRLRFQVVGHGCTTCNGNSGPLEPEVSQAIRERDLVAVAVLSGNRNFEGRIHPEVRATYLASPPLVVAYALAGTMDIDLARRPLGHDPNGSPVFLRDIWPTRGEIEDLVVSVLRPEMFRHRYREGAGDEPRWEAIPSPTGPLFAWDESSTYLRPSPFLEDPAVGAGPVGEVRGARVLAVLGDDITTDHISPGGSIDPDSPAGEYLLERGVRPEDFNSYAARRGNHEVMVRGTFANNRLQNRLAPQTEGGFTRRLPGGEAMSIFEAAVRYRAEGVPLIILAGKRYGGGSSRDWAAKGPKLLGVRAVIAESFERIHRSNLVGMGILPLQFRDGQGAAALGLTGEEVYSIQWPDGAIVGREVAIVAERPDGSKQSFTALARLNTPQEVSTFACGGIVPELLHRSTIAAASHGAHETAAASS